VQILKSEGELFALWYSSYTKIKPGSVKVCVFEMWLTIACHPQIKEIFLAAPISLAEVT
jgi:hypothetical protein